jgi:8-oxo-dGTP diphosphatase
VKATSGQFVVGFVMDDNGRRVLLLRKRRPAWQDGLLNGCGGRVEPSETFEQAMIREAREEIGVDRIPFAHVVTLRRGEFECRFYRAFSTSAFAIADAQTDELVERHWTSVVIGSPDLVPNLNWILPLAVDPCIKLPIEVEDADSNDLNWRRWTASMIG